MDRNSYIAVRSQPREEQEPADPTFAVGIGGSILAVVAFLGAWAFQTIASSWKEDIMELRVHVDKIESNHFASCELFVRREDYLRGMESIDKKLDNLTAHQDKQMESIDKKLDNLTAHQDKQLDRQDQQIQILLGRLTTRHHDAA